MREAAQHHAARAHIQGARALRQIATRARQPVNVDRTALRGSDHCAAEAGHHPRGNDHVGHVGQIRHRAARPVSGIKPIARCATHPSDRVQASDAALRVAGVSDGVIAAAVAVSHHRCAWRQRFAGAHILVVKVKADAAHRVACKTQCCAECRQVCCGSGGGGLPVVDLGARRCSQCHGFGRDGA